MNATFRAVIPAAIALLAVASPSVSRAFEVRWTDPDGQTAYVLLGPDRVVVGEAFTVTIAVTDTTNPGTEAASDWTFTMHALVTDGGASIPLDGNTWSRSYSLTDDALGLHPISFAGTDGGHLSHHPVPFSLTAEVLVDASAPIRPSTWGSIKRAFHR